MVYQDGRIKNYETMSKLVKVMQIIFPDTVYCCSTVLFIRRSI